MNGPRFSLPKVPGGPYEEVFRTIRAGLQALRDHPAEPPRGQALPARPPFTPSLYKDGASYKVTFTPGYVHEIRPETAAALTVHEVYVGTTALTAATPPPLTLALTSGAGYIYLKLETENDGQLKDQGTGEFATLVASATEQNSTHFEPPDKDDANDVDGIYYIQVAEYEDDPLETGKPRLKKGSGIRGNLVWRVGYNALASVGAGTADGYREYDLATDRHEIASHSAQTESPGGAYSDYDNILVVDGDNILYNTVGAGLNLTIEEWYIDGSTGDVDASGSPESGSLTHYWREGLYKGTTAPDALDDTDGIIEAKAIYFTKTS